MTVISTQIFRTQSPHTSKPSTLNHPRTLSPELELEILRSKFWAARNICRDPHSKGICSALQRREGASVQRRADALWGSFRMMPALVKFVQLGICLSLSPSPSPSPLPSPSPSRCLSLSLSLLLSLSLSLPLSLSLFFFLFIFLFLSPWRSICICGSCMFYIRAQNLWIGSLLQILQRFTF